MNMTELLFAEFGEYFTINEIAAMVDFVQHHTFVNAVGLDDCVKFACNTVITYAQRIAAAQTTP